LGTTHLHETILEYEAIFQLKNHMLLHWFTPITCGPVQLVREGFRKTYRDALKCNILICELEIEFLIKHTDTKVRKSKKEWKHLVRRFPKPPMRQTWSIGSPILFL
jgi:hypothetical protein